MHNFDVYPDPDADSKPCTLVANLPLVSTTQAAESAPKKLMCLLILRTMHFFLQARHFLSAPSLSVVGECAE